MVISSVDIIFLGGIPKDNIYVGIKGGGAGNRNSGQEQNKGGTCRAQGGSQLNQNADQKGDVLPGEIPAELSIGSAGDHRAEAEEGELSFSPLPVSPSPWSCCRVEMPLPLPRNSPGSRRDPRPRVLAAGSGNQLHGNLWVRSNQITQDEPTLPLGTLHLCSHFLLPSPWPDLASDGSAHSGEIQIICPCSALPVFLGPVAPSPGLPNFVPAETKLQIKAPSRACPGVRAPGTAKLNLPDGFNSGLCSVTPVLQEQPLLPPLLPLAISSLLKNIQRGYIKANIVLLLPGVTLDENYMKQ